MYRILISLKCVESSIEWSYRHHVLKSFDYLKPLQQFESTFITI